MANLSVSPQRGARSRVAFRPAEADDADGIRALLRESPFGGRIALTLESDPAHPPPLAVPGRAHTVVAARPTAPRRIIGLADRTVYPAWVDGKAVRIGYLGRLRRKRVEDLTLRRLREGFALLEAGRRDDEHPCDFTSILTGNRPARRLLERGLPGLPRYVPAGTMVTLTIATSRAAHRPADGVRPLEPAGHDAARSLLERHHRARQLSPRFDASIFALPGTHWFTAEAGGRLHGCAALWDQGPFKAVAIHRYAPWLRRLRRPLNAVRRATGAPLLPPEGTRVPLAFLAFLAVDNDDPASIVGLVRAAAGAAQGRGLPFLTLGLPADHPGVPALRSAFRPEATVATIYLVSPPGREGVPPRPDLPVHPEIALL